MRMNKERMVSENECGEQQHLTSAKLRTSRFHDRSFACESL